MDAPSSPILQALYAGNDGEASEASRDRQLDVFEAAGLGERHRLTELLDGSPDLVGATAEVGFTPLHLAALFTNDEEVVRLLLERGADVNARANNAMAVTPLNAAAARQHGAVVRALLDGGAAVDAAQRDGYTALHSAAANGDSTLVEMLLGAGADVEARSDAGDTPADVANARGHADVGDRLGRSR